ncbi:PREDICTED: lysosomal Pro-X carboxypeptidase-like [Camelina sativa]|uniref:Lysosomal Pro-X carboxypeptidase-like n=1 Tax=Camelina sativa TaxID=90675 RepID=A0ABM0U8W4_CAMSA|nr:PREDICTED: lysosomal Pro-X carboxypeptidase-like [Camelina sativa]
MESLAAQVSQENEIPLNAGLRNLDKKLEAESISISCHHVWWFLLMVEAVLAAWFVRLQYPHIAIGALASSAPVPQFDKTVPSSSFYDTVSQDFEIDLGHCTDPILVGCAGPHHMSTSFTPLSRLKGRSYSQSKISHPFVQGTTSSSFLVRSRSTTHVPTHPS